MQSITKKIAFAAAAALAWACSEPTGMLCACPPSRTTLMIAGTLRNALGTPEANKLVTVEATAAEFPLLTFTAATVLTDSVGKFSVLAYSTYSPGAYSVTARVIGSTPSDTIRLQMGSANFKHEREKPDTLRASLQLP
jgi:hypothetical protein